MKTYSEFAPTSCDRRGLAFDDKQDWLVAGTVNRDSDALSRSNYRCTLNAIEAADPSGESHAIGSFGHWACGWIDVLIVKPGTPAAEVAQEIAEGLEDYPVVNEYDFSEEEQEEANETWRECYTWPERVKYIRDNRRQFEFHDLQDLMGCVRGRYFAGEPSELIS